MPKQEEHADLEKLMGISPLVRHVRVMQSKNLSGTFRDYDYVLTIIADGKARFFVNGVRYDLSRGNVLLMPPGKEHVIIPEEDKELTQCIFHFDMFFDPARVNIWGQNYEDVMNSVPTSQRELDIFPDPVLWWHLDDNEFLDVRSAFLKMQMHYTRQEPAFSVYLKYLCIKILVICCGSGDSTRIKGTSEITTAQMNVQRAIEIIRRNYDDPMLSNEAIAKQLDITPKYLSYIFKSVLGVPPHQYLTQTRINMAETMISLQKFNVTEIAFAVGYESIHSFSKVFKQKTGFSPSEYMKKLITGEEKAFVKY